MRKIYTPQLPESTDENVKEPRSFLKDDEERFRPLVSDDAAQRRKDSVCSDSEFGMFLAAIYVTIQQKSSR